MGELSHIVCDLYGNQMSFSIRQIPSQVHRYVDRNQRATTESCRNLEEARDSSVVRVAGRATGERVR